MKNFLKLWNHSNVKMVIILTCLFFIYTTICAISYANTVSTDIADSVFRLHVIANSDSDADQNLKYIVRDHLLDYMNTLCENCTSKEEAISIANQHIENFKEIEEYDKMTTLRYQIEREKIPLTEIGSCQLDDAENTTVSKLYEYLSVARL